MRGMLIRTLTTTRQGEINIDRGVNLYRLAVEVVRLVLPLLYCIQRRTREHGVTADYVQVLNAAIFADQGLKHYNPLNTGLASKRRIGRLHFVDQQSLRNALGYAHPLRSGFGNGHGRVAEHSAQNTTHRAPGHTARYATHNTGDSRGR